MRPLIHSVVAVVCSVGTCRHVAAQAVGFGREDYRRGGHVRGHHRPRGPSRKLDQYGDIQIADERARLDSFAVELQNDPTADTPPVMLRHSLGAAGDVGR